MHYETKQAYRGEKSLEGGKGRYLTCRRKSNRRLHKEQPHNDKGGGEALRNLFTKEKS